MKIILNAASAKVTGVVTYITNLLRHLPGPGSGMQFTVYLLPETAAKVGSVAPNVHLTPTEIGRAGILKRLWWEQVTLRRILKKMGADALFSTANFGMFSCPVRQILLVRNTLYFSKIYREMFLPRHRLKARIAFELRRWLIVRSVRSADVVMTPTQAMLDELSDYVRLDEKETLVNHYGVSLADLSVKQKEERRVRESPRPDVTRLVFVSGYCEHKNLGTLLKAMPALNRNGGRKFVLKTTADPSWKVAEWTVTHTSDSALAKRPEVAKWVEIVGLQNRPQTARLYAEGDIFVFPSLTESFGFPMAEAMAFGLPIVAANTPVNREICSDAAIYFRPLDAEDLAQKVEKLAADHCLRSVLSMNGRRQAQNRYEWSMHVRQLIEAACVSEGKKSLTTENGRPSRKSTKQAPPRRKGISSLCL